MIANKKQMKALISTSEFFTFYKGESGIKSDCYVFVADTKERKRSFKENFIDDMNKGGFPLNVMRSNALFVAMNQRGEILGFAALNQRNGHWYFRKAYIKSKFRRNRLQRALIMARLKYLQRKGINKVSCLVEDINIASYKNILACGFTKAGKRKPNLWRFVIDDIKTALR